MSSEGVYYIPLGCQCWRAGEAWTQQWRQCPRYWPFPVPHRCLCPASHERYSRNDTILFFFLLSLLYPLSSLLSPLSSPLLSLFSPYLSLPLSLFAEGR